MCEANGVGGADGQAGRSRGERGVPLGSRSFFVVTRPPGHRRRYLALFVDDVHQDRPCFMKKPAEDSVTTVALSECGDVLACGGMDSLVRVFDVATGSELFAKKFAVPVQAVCLGTEPVVGARSPSTARINRHSPAGGAVGALEAGVHTCTRLGVGCFKPGRIEWIDFSFSARRTWDQTDSDEPGQPVTPLPTALDDALASDWERGRILFEWENGAGVNALAASSRGDELAVAGEDCKATIYCLKTGNPLCVSISPPCGFCLPAALSSDTHLRRSPHRARARVVPVVSYVFDDPGVLWTIALSERNTYIVKLSDGTVMQNLDECQLQLAEPQVEGDSPRRSKHTRPRGRLPVPGDTVEARGAWPNCAARQRVTAALACLCRCVSMRKL